ncbi:MAG: glycosyltransferase family 4 protein [Anaerolineae bacterium]|jgi:glycosyltransferase involved in cell wall biosynthesis|nr:glycosyltransferase family 4 protein [Anaerolineae bacterium]
MSPLHIAINAWFWSRPDTGSGQYVIQLVQALRSERDLKITLILPQAVQDLPDGVNTVIIGSPLRGHWGKLLFEQVLVPYHAAQIGADLLHVPYWATPMITPLPTITTIFDVITRIFPQYRAGWLAESYVRLVERSAHRSAHILTDSHAARSDIATQLRIDPSRITVTWLATTGAFSPTPTPEDAIVKAKYHLPDRFVLYLGGFQFHKNLLTLIDAYAPIAQEVAIPLILAGRLPSAWGSVQFPDLPGRIAEHGLGDQVRLIGQVSDRDKVSLYRLATLFVFPSLYEGFGLPPLEAMACGCPVIVGDRSSVPEIVGEAGILVDARDPQALTDAIRRGLTDATLHADLVQRGIDRAAHFSWKQTAQATLRCYQETLGLRRAGKQRL